MRLHIQMCQHSNIANYLWVAVMRFEGNPRLAVITSKRSHKAQCETPNCQIDLDFQFSGQFNFKKATQFIM